MFVLLPKRALGGDALGWRRGLRGDRPFGLDAGGSKMMFPLKN